MTLAKVSTRWKFAALSGKPLQLYSMSSWIIILGWIAVVGIVANTQSKILRICCLFYLKLVIHVVPISE